MTTVFVPGQGDVDFPDSMSDDQIAGVIKKQFPLLKGESGVTREDIAGKPTQQQDRGFLEKAVGAGEAGLSMASGMVAAPIGAAAGVARSLVGGNLGTQQGVQEGQQEAQRVSSALTYEPRTEAGKEALGAVGEAVDTSKLGGLPIGDMSAMGALSSAKGASEIGASKQAELATKQAQNVVKDTTLSQARQAGYVLPPSMAKPSVLNNLVEGVAGKIKTAQKASFKNQEVTNNLAREALGLASDAPLNADTLQAVRQQAGKSYEAIKNTGRITADKEYFDALDKIKAPYEQAAKDFPKAANKDVIKTINAMKRREFDSASAVDQIGNLREMADKAFRTGDKTLGRATKNAAKALEDQVERHLQTREVPAIRPEGKINQTTPRGLLGEFRHAREIIAKSYTVQKALNEGSGNVSARVLANELKKGKPLSGPLKTAARTAREFPKATQDVSTIGSPTSVSLFDMGAAGIAAEAMHNPGMLAGVLGRPALRSAMLSGPGQNAMVGTPSYTLGAGLRLGRTAAENPELLSSLPMENQ